MSFAMGVIGNGSITTMIISIIVGLIGIFGMSINYFIYKKLIEQGKKNIRKISRVKRSIF